MRVPLGRRLFDLLHRAWAAIRRRHHDVPDVIILAKPAGGRVGKTLGYFWALRWQARGRDYHEMAVIAEHLNRSAEDLMGLLLHEAAHALNFVRGIKDCSASQYHNRRFKFAAEELGLQVTQVEHYGFASTKMTNETTVAYGAAISDLKKVLLRRRLVETAPREPSRSRRARCRCGHIIRFSSSTMSSTRILCGNCKQQFRFD